MEDMMIQLHVRKNLDGIGNYVPRQRWTELLVAELHARFPSHDVTVSADSLGGIRSATVAVQRGGDTWHPIGPEALREQAEEVLARYVPADDKWLPYPDD